MKYSTIIKYKKFVQKLKLIATIIFFTFITIILASMYPIMGIFGIVAGGIATIPPYLKAEKEIKEMEMIYRNNKEEDN